MKSERRHELRENDLVHYLNSVRDYLEEKGGRVAFVAITIVVVAGVAAFALRSRAAAIEDVWLRRAKLSYNEPEEGRQSLATLRELTQQVSDPKFIMDSLMDQGRQALSLAQQVPDPPDPEFNRDAQTAFQSLHEQFPDSAVAVGVALLGLATVEENAFVIDGEMAHKDKAHELLSRIIHDAKLNGLPAQTVATKRREALDVTFSRITLASSPEIREEELEKAEPAPDNVDTP